MRGSPDPVDSPEWIQACLGIENYYSRMEPLLTGQEYFAGAATYADIAFYMAQFFAARHTVPMTVHPNLLAWRRRMAERPAVKHVIGAMAAYLRSIGLPVPDFGAA
jgi:glutathione S-transferase